MPNAARGNAQRRSRGLPSPHAAFSKPLRGIKKAPANMFRRGLELFQECLGEPRKSYVVFLLICHDDKNSLVVANIDLTITIDIK